MMLSAFCACKSVPDRPDQLEVGDEPQRRKVRNLVPRSELILWDSSVPFPQRDAQLAAREVRPETTVHATAEGEVPVHGSIEPHLERIGELCGVKVGRAEVNHDVVSGFHDLTAHRGRLSYFK